MDRVRLQQLGLAAKDVAQNVMISLSGSMQASPAYWLNPSNGNTYTIGVRSPETALEIWTPCCAPRWGPTRTAPSCSATWCPCRQAMAPMVTSYNTNPSSTFTPTWKAVTWAASAATSRPCSTRSAQAARGVDLALRGQVETLHSSFAGLALGLAVAIVLVYLLLVVNFQSWLDPLIIISALPAALAGIAWLLFLSGTTSACRPSPAPS
jgi:multidrug efflux pump subunit AcrB